MKMYDGVLERVRILEEKNGICYAKVNGRLYNSLKFGLILSFVYVIIIKLIYFLGSLVEPKGAIEVLNPLIYTCVLIAGFVITLCKQQLLGAILTVVPSGLLAVSFLRVLKSNNLDVVPFKFYWAHLIPLGLLCIFAVWIAVISLRANVKTKKNYAKVSTSLYENYKINVSDGEEISEEQWAEFLSKYDPYSYNNQILEPQKNEENNP